MAQKIEMHLYHCPEHQREQSSSPDTCHVIVGQVYICHDCKRAIGAHANRVNVIICDVCGSSDVGLRKIACGATLIMVET